LAHRQRPVLDLTPKNIVFFLLFVENRALFLDIFVGFKTEKKPYFYEIHRFRDFVNEK